MPGHYSEIRFDRERQDARDRAEDRRQEREYRTVRYIEAQADADASQPAPSPLRKAHKYDHMAQVRQSRRAKAKLR